MIRIFPNEESLIRLMGSVLMDIHEKWTTGGRSYFTMDKYYEERDAREEEGKGRPPRHPSHCVLTTVDRKEFTPNILDLNNASADWSARASSGRSRP